jgi:microcystin-dependent protein
MAQPFVGEIRIFAGNFPPAGWAFCDGTLVSIAENETLFNLIGTTYGGDGQTTFALPDLRGRAAVGVGQGSGLSSYVLGEQGGVESVTLTTNQIPRHGLAVSDLDRTRNHPTGVVAVGGAYRPAGDADGAGAFATVGGNQPHENMPPFLATSFIISLFGIFPSPA